MDLLAYLDAKANELEDLLNGSKTMVIRGAAGRKLPYGRVFEGYVLYFILNNSEGKVRDSATVKSVINSKKITPEESITFVDEHQNILKLTPKQYKRWPGNDTWC